MIESVLRNDIKALHKLTKEIHELMSSVPAGLAALQQSVSDLATAVAASTSAIAALLQKVSASEDPAVQALAAQIETQVGALNQAVASINPPAPPAA